MPSLDHQRGFVSSSSAACGLVSQHPAGCFILVFFTAAAAARSFAKKRESRLLAAFCGTERSVRDQSRLLAGFSCDQEELLGFSSSQRCSEDLKITTRGGRSPGGNRSPGRRPRSEVGKTPRRKLLEDFWISCRKKRSRSFILLLNLTSREQVHC